VTLTGLAATELYGEGNVVLEDGVRDIGGKGGRRSSTKRGGRPSFGGKSLAGEETSSKGSQPFLAGKKGRWKKVLVEGEMASRERGSGTSSPYA